MIGPLKTVEERDILGDCETEYSEMNPIDKHIDGVKISKRKNLHTCRNRLMPNNLLLPSPVIARIGEKSSNYMMKNEYKCIQEIGLDRVIRNVNCVESTGDIPMIEGKRYSRESYIRIEYVRTESEIIRSQRGPFKRQSLLYTKYEEPVTSEKHAIDVLHKVCLSVVDEMKPDAPNNFKRLIYALKGMDYEMIIRLMQSVEVENGVRECKTMKLKGILESALLMSGGRGAIRYLTEKIETVDLDQPGKMITLFMLPFIANPNEESVKAILPFLKNVKSPKLMLYATAMIGNFIRLNDSCPAMMPAVKEAVDIIAEKLPTECAMGEMKYDEIVAYLRSLGNTGFLTQKAMQKLIGCVKNKSTMDDVRVSALDALRRTDVCNYPHNFGGEMKMMLTEMLKNRQENDEMLVTAYRTMMSCGKGFGEEMVIQKALDMMRNGENKRLAAYVYTYLKNMKKNKSPENRKMREMLMNEDITFEMPENEMFSKNLAFSHYSSSLHLGMVFDMDYIVNKNSKYPRALNVKVKVPLYERTMDLLEIGLRQDGNDAAIDEVVEFFKNNKFDDILMNIKHLMDKKSSEKNYRQLQEKLLSMLRNMRSISMHVNYNENTLIYGTIDDFGRVIARQKRDIMTIIGFAQGRGNPGNLVEKPISLYKTMAKMYSESGLGFMTVSELEMPTISGIPMRAYVRGTFLMTNSRSDGPHNFLNVVPNFGFVLCAGVKTFLHHDHMVGIKYKSTVLSNFGLKLKLAEGYDGTNTRTVELKPMKPEMSLFKLKSNFYIDNAIVNKPLITERSPRLICSDEMIGFSFCYKMHVDRNVDIDFMLKQSDPGMEGVKLVVTYPRENYRMFHYYMHLSTPGSRVERYVEAEIKEIYNPDFPSQYNYMIKSPKMKLNGDFFIKPGHFKLQFNMNEKKHLYELMMRSQAVPTFDIMLNLKVDNPYMSEPLDVSYLLVEKIRPNYELKTELVHARKGSRMRLIKADFISETQSMSKRMRRSMEEPMKYMLNLQVGNQRMNQWINLNTVLQKSGFIAFDTLVDYKTKQMVKIQKIEIHGKMKPKSMEDMFKLMTTGEMMFTEWPQYNAYFNQSMVIKRGEYMENHLMMKWSGKMEDSRKEINIHQNLKRMQEGEMSIIKGNLQVYIGPKSFNHEVMYTAKRRKGDLPLHQHELSFIDLNTNQKREAIAKFEMVSRVPQKLIYGVSWKCPSGEKSVFEEINEIKPNQYLGKTVIKSQMRGKPPVGYLVDTLTTNSVNRSYFDTDVKIYRLESNERLAMFKLLGESGNIHRLVSTLTFKGRQMYDLDYFLDTKIGLLKHSLSIEDYAKLSLTADNSQDYISDYKLAVRCDRHGFTHSSEMRLNRKAYDPEYGYTVKSSTIYQNKVLLNMDIKHLLKRSLLTEISNDDFDLKFISKREPNSYTSTFDLETARWIHKSSLSCKPMQTMFKTETKKDDLVLMKGIMQIENGKLKQVMIKLPKTIDMSYEKSAEHHYLKMHHEKSNLYHETLFKHNPKKYNIDLRSKTNYKDAENIYDLQFLSYYDNPESYELKTSLGLGKDPDFIFGVRSSKEGKKFNMQLNDFTPITYSTRVRRSAPNEPLFKTEANYDEKNGFKAVATSQLLDIDLRVGTKFAKLVIEGKSVPIYHETVYQRDDVSRNVTSITKYEGEVVVQYSRVSLPGKRYISLDNLYFTLNIENEKISPQEEKITGDLLNKVSQKHRSLTLVRKEDNEKYTLNVNLVDKNNPQDFYNIIFTVPLNFEKEFRMNVESKGSNNCESNLNMNYQHEDGNFDGDYKLQCAASEVTAKVSRKKTGKNYHHFVDLKKNNEVLLNLDSKLKLSEDNRPLSWKIRINSAVKKLDGAYLDLKREYPSDGIKSELAVKPPYTNLLYTSKYEMRSKVGSKKPKYLSYHGRLENTVTGDAKKLDIHIETENVVDLSFKVSKQVGDVETPIVSRRMYYSNDLILSDFEYRPLNILYNVTILPKENKYTMELVYKAVDIVRLESIMTSKRDVQEKELSARGSIFGYPVSSKMSIGKERTNLKISLKPLVENYPYVIPVSGRLTDCYKPSTEDCITLHMMTDNVRRKVLSVNAKLKMNPRNSGDKYTMFVAYDNADKDNTIDRKLMITNDKDNTVYGYHVVRNPTMRDRKIFLKNGRVIRSLFTRVDAHTTVRKIWLDAERQPDRKLTITRTYTHSDIEQKVDVIISHPVLKKDISFKSVAKKEGKVRQLRSELDYSTDPNDKLHLDMDIDQTSSSHELSFSSLAATTLKLYRADKKLDLVYNNKKLMSTLHNSIENVDVLTKVAEILKQTQWKSSDGTFKSVLNAVNITTIRKQSEIEPVKVLYNQVYQRLSLYFSVDVETVIPRRHALPLVKRLDLTFSKDGPTYRMNSSYISTDSSRCLKSNFFKLPFGSGLIKYAMICLHRSGDKPLFELLTGDEGQTERSIDVSVVRKPNEDGIYVVSLKWNPEKVERRILDLVHAVDKYYDSYIKAEQEIEREREFLVNTVLPSLEREVLNPLKAHVEQELKSIVKENPNLFWPYVDNVTRRMKRNVHTTRAARHGKTLVEILKRLSTFRMISYNPDKGEIIFEIGSKYV
ncbi:apolipophorins-like protein [Dinothrombium tinctorium]|uniref:Apolipophorins-like protein n=1 Tax=Dinothrombium tinctorium TaxID=1965070 RepID=A0A443RB29_9ACAR|nr:apolipophorins-like protein [Dinothrombium tinctorium]